MKHKLVFINGVPLNVWPLPKCPHLCDIAEVEDVDYEEVESITIKENEESEIDN